MALKADRPTILALCDYYLPGYKAGGPIRTLAGMVEQLADEFHFKIATRDRDLGEAKVYSNVTINSWQLLGPAQVAYLPPAGLSYRAIRRLLSATDHEVLYLNSCFSIPFSMLPLALRRLGFIPYRPVVIAPRGELASGALALNSGRKRLYLTVAKLLGLLRDVTWQASGTHEAEDIKRCFGVRCRVVVAPDLTSSMRPRRSHRTEKKPGHLRLLFVSRISPMKNLDGALVLLRGAPGSVRLSIYGPLEDATYWRHCQQLMTLLPPNVTAEYRGAASHERIGMLMAEHDLLFLPTLGENFGHVILEAMANGCPVLISDKTRWHGLEEARAGWDIPLDALDTWRSVLHDCVAMNGQAWRALSKGARRYASQFLNDSAPREQNRLLFRIACGREQVTS